MAGFAKRIIAFITSLLLVINLTPLITYAENGVIYEKIEEETVSRGVTLQKITQYTNNGWQTIFMLKADLNDPYITTNIITYGSGLSGTTNVKTFIKDSGCLGGINADFFQRKSKSSDAAPIGVVISDGIMRSTPATDPGMGALYMDWDKNMSADYLKSEILITAPNGESRYIRHINKYEPLGDMIIYTPAWGDYSIGSNDGIIEMVVSNNIVTEIRKDQPPTTIPKDGYIIATLDYNTFLDNFQVGDEVKIDIKMTPDLDGIQNAVGGGTLLIKDGEKVPFTHNITGRHPRSAAGIDETGKILYLIAVDGRTQSAIGMTQDELANFMLAHGMSTGINFDGGGSTTFVSRNEAKTEVNVLNNPSDGSLRTVTNAIGIKSTAPEGGLASLKIETMNSRIFMNTSRIVAAYGMDEYKNPRYINPSDVEWSCEGVDGYFSGNRFFPTSSGTGKIIARIGEAEGTYDIYVADKPYSLKLSANEYKLDGKEKGASLYGKDSEGYDIPINLVDTMWSVSGNVAKLESGVIIPQDNGNGILSVTVGDVTAYAAIYNRGNEGVSAPWNTSLPDILDKPKTEESKTVAVFGNTVNTVTLLDNLVMSRLISNINKNAEYAAFLGNAQPENLKELKVPIVDIGNRDSLSDIDVELMWLNNSGSLKNVDGQWGAFLDRCENSYQDNVVVFLSSSLNSFTDKAELNLFKEILTKKLAQKGKNVFVFYNNDVSSFDISNGVRYIGVPNVTQSMSKEEILQKARQINYVLLHKNENGLTYEIKNLFK